MFTNCSSLL